MTSVYLIDVMGDGVSPETAFRADTTADHHCLMVHEAKAKAIIVSPDDTIATGNARRLVQAVSLAALRTKAATTSPTTTQRNQAQTWATAAGYGTIPAGVTWLELIRYLARRVNPDADL